LLIIRDEYTKLLEFSYVAENYLLDFIVTCIGSMEFEAEKNIPVKKPFGKKETRENKIEKGKEPIVTIKPECCLIYQHKGFIGEAAGAKDTKPSEKNYSESHQRIWELVENEIQSSEHSLSNAEIKKRIYFAQKIMCQLFPVFLYLKNDKNISFVKCYYATIAEHKIAMEFVFNLLHTSGYISSVPKRPLEYMDYDINKYGLAIYEINFPTSNLNQSWINDNLDLFIARQGHARAEINPNRWDKTKSL